MTRCPLRILLTAVACAFALREPQGRPSRTRPVPQTPQPPAQAPSPPAPGGRQGRGNLDESADFLKRPPVVRQIPPSSRSCSCCRDGYRIEPVLADPLIEDPVGVTFDGNGRMYVLEMRSYMQDADGTQLARADQPHLAPRRHRRRRRLRQAHRLRRQPGDAAHRVSARRRRASSRSRPTTATSTSTPTRTATASPTRRSCSTRASAACTNMEWQPGGLTWALDNWLYTTYNPFRLRIAPGGKMLREETEPNGGQWWSAQDNYGKIWWVDGGGEIGPVNIQAPIAYGAFNVPDNFEPDFQVPWPAPGGIADMQGGMRRVRLPDGTLNHFTAASGVEIYRGDRLPQDSSAISSSTSRSARIVRRAKVVVTDGLTQLQNAYPKSEFVRSTDPLFRPVSISNAPDGTLYLVGHVHRHHPGRAVRRARIRTCGRRSSSTSSTSSTTGAASGASRTRARRRICKQPRMYSETAAQLVEHLEHPNGWWRDTAQKLLVLQAGQVGRAGAADDGARVREPARADSRAVDARRAGVARRAARARVDEEPGSADPHPGDPRERDALQGRRQVIRRRLPRDDEGRRSRTSSSRRC